METVNTKEIIHSEEPGSLKSKVELPTSSFESGLSPFKVPFVSVVAESSLDLLVNVGTRRSAETSSPSGFYPLNELFTKYGDVGSQDFEILRKVVGHTPWDVDGVGAPHLRYKNHCGFAFSQYDGHQKYYHAIDDYVDRKDVQAWLVNAWTANCAQLLNIKGFLLCMLAGVTPDKCVTCEGYPVPARLTGWPLDVDVDTVVPLATPLLWSKDCSKLPADGYCHYNRPASHVHGHSEAYTAKNWTIAIGSEDAFSFRFGGKHSRITLSHMQMAFVDRLIRRVEQCIDGVANSDPSLLLSPVEEYADTLLLDASSKEKDGCYAFIANCFILALIMDYKNGAPKPLAAAFTSIGRHVDFLDSRRAKVRAMCHYFESGHMFTQIGTFNVLKAFCATKQHIVHCDDKSFFLQFPGEYVRQVMGSKKQPSVIVDTALAKYKTIMVMALSCMSRQQSLQEFQNNSDVRRINRDVIAELVELETLDQRAARSRERSEDDRARDADGAHRDVHQRDFQRDGRVDVERITRPQLYPSHQHQPQQQPQRRPQPPRSFDDQDGEDRHQRDYRNRGDTLQRERVRISGPSFARRQSSDRLPTLNSGDGSRRTSPSDMGNRPPDTRRAEFHYDIAGI